VPSGALAHFPLRQLALPQSRSDEQLEPGEVAHFPLRHETPSPQSRSEEQSPGVGWGGPSFARTGAAATKTRPRERTKARIEVQRS
jgi:hypothetical protein